MKLLRLIRCVRCKSAKVVSYSARNYCLNCGFTFHKDSKDEMDELIRRQVLSIKKETA
jgi:hypothetical protein